MCCGSSLRLRILHSNRFAKSTNEARSRVSRLQHGNGEMFTVAVEAESISVGMRFVRSRPQSSDDTRFQPFRVDAEKHFGAGADPGWKGAMDVTIRLYPADGAKSLNEKQVKRLNVAGLVITGRQS